MVLKKISILICAATLCGIVWACKADLSNKNDSYSGSYVRDNNPYLKSLAFSSGTLNPAFDTEVFSYMLLLCKSVDSITITPTAQWIYAGILVNGTAVDTGSPSGGITLEIGNNAVEIVVTSEDKKYSQTYNIDIYRAISLPATAQTKCYESDGAGTDEIACAGTGQDGEYKKGTAWDPAARFTDNGDGTVTDALTGLIWQQDANSGGSKNWIAALSYCNSLSDGWRLPNVLEMAGLANYNLNGTLYDWLNSSTIDNVNNGLYYSSSTKLKMTNQAWRFSTVNNNVSATMAKGNPYYTWAVKTGEPGKIQLPKTSQTDCYNGTTCTGTGEDGEYQTGVEWPDPRFIDNSDGTITDRLTGLMWQAQGLIGADFKTWQGALTYANDLTLADYDDWRLPNINELNSLYNFGVEDVVVYLESRGFNTLQNGNTPTSFWSSTTYVSNAANAWCMAISSDAPEAMGFSRPKNLVYNVICVRDSQMYSFNVFNVLF